MSVDPKCYTQSCDNIKKRDHISAILGSVYSLISKQWRKNWMSYRKNYKDSHWRNFVHQGLCTLNVGIVTLLINQVYFVLTDPSL